MDVEVKVPAPENPELLKAPCEPRAVFVSPISEDTKLHMIII